MKIFMLAGLVVSLTAVTSCGDDGGTDPQATQTVWEIIESNDDLASLESEFSSFADIVATLNDPTATLTVFAPTDQALSTLLTTLGLTDFSTVSQDVAEAVLAYHVVTSAAIASGELTGSVTTLQGEAITVEDGPSLVSGATSPSAIQTGDIQALNGVVHLVDVVLVPPTIGALIVQTLGTSAQPLLLGADFTTLAEGMAKADAANTDPTATILATLIGGENLTIFAPSNATFLAGEITVDTYDAATWDAIIRNHIVVGGSGGTTIGDTDMTTGATSTTLYGGTLLFHNDTQVIPAANGIGIYIDSNGSVDLMDAATYTTFDAEVALIDLGGAGVTSNGRIHAIAGVLSPF